MSLNIRRVLSVVAAVVVAASFSAAAHAQDKMATPAPKMDKMAGGKMDKMDSSVYACKACKMYYSAADAKKMAYKDPMGHKLAKMSKAPAGYKMGSAKMDKMGGKMDSGKMDKMTPKP